MEVKYVKNGDSNKRNHISSYSVFKEYDFSAEDPLMATKDLIINDYTIDDLLGMKFDIANSDEVKRIEDLFHLVDNDKIHIAENIIENIRVYDNGNIYIGDKLLQLYNLDKKLKLIDGYKRYLNIDKINKIIFEGE